MNLNMDTENLKIILLPFKRKITLGKQAVHSAAAWRRKMETGKERNASEKEC